MHVRYITVSDIRENISVDDSMHRFQDILIKNGIHCRIRRERGTDIGSACGQLRLNNKKD